MKTAYIGQVIHNRTLDLEAMSKDCAVRRRISEEEARFHLSCVGSYIAEAVAKGDRLNFREFSVALKMTGTFSRGNERYDAKKNPLKVVMTPSLCSFCLLICKMQNRGVFALGSLYSDMIQSASNKLSPNLQSAD